MIRVVRMIMTLGRWDDRGEEIDQDAADQVSEEVD